MRCDLRLEGYLFLCFHTFHHSSLTIFLLLSPFMYSTVCFGNKADVYIKVRVRLTAWMESAKIERWNISTKKNKNIWFCDWRKWKRIPNAAFLHHLNKALLKIHYVYKYWTAIYCGLLSEAIFVFCLSIVFRYGSFQRLYKYFHGTQWKKLLYVLPSTIESIKGMAQ